MTATERADEPWSRWGWLIGAVWIVFLAFPISLLLQEHTEPLARAIGLTLIGAFAVAYVLGFVAINRCDDGQWRGAPWLLGVLGLLTIGVAFLIGVNALGMVPFVVSFAAWSLRWPVGIWVGAAITAVALGALLLSGAEDAWVYPLLLGLILGFAALMRTLEHRAAQQHQLNEVMAVVNERERVARDVHDVLGHSLTAISIKAELAERLMEVDPPRAAGELAQVQTLARDALAEIRTTVTGLRATRIDEELERARDALTAAGMRADLPRRPDVVEVSNRIVLAWALREAVTNVVRHSGARRCVVTLGPNLLVVTDDGVSPLGPEGNGLRGLRERVAATGGSVSFLAPDTGGHELRVQL